MCRSRSLVLVAVVLAGAVLVGCDSAVEPAATVISSTTRQVGSVTSSTVAPASEPIETCPQIDPAESAGGNVELTLRERYEEVIDPGDVGMCIRVSGDQGPVYQQRFEMLGEEWSHAGRQLSVVSLMPAEYQIQIHTEPSRRVCTTTIDLTGGVDLTAVALFRMSCSFQVEETEAWHVEATGFRAPPSAIEEYYGPGHCGWNALRFMLVDVSEISGLFLRDPTNKGFPAEHFLSTAFRDELGLDEYGMVEDDRKDIPDDAILTFAIKDSLPTDAVSLGYVRGNRELWVSPGANSDYIFVTTPDGVERWPQMRPEIGCM